MASPRLPSASPVDSSSGTNIQSPPRRDARRWPARDVRLCHAL